MLLGNILFGQDYLMTIYPGLSSTFAMKIIYHRNDFFDSRHTLIEGSNSLLYLLLSQVHFCIFLWHIVYPKSLAPYQGISEILVKKLLFFFNFAPFVHKLGQREINQKFTQNFFYGNIMLSWKFERLSLIM